MLSALAMLLRALVFYVWPLVILLVPLLLCRARLERFALLFFWLLAIFLAPFLLILAGLNFRASWGYNTDGFSVPAIWLISLFATAPWIGRRLNRDLLTVAEPTRLDIPPHLGPSLREVFRDAAEIRRDLTPERFDACLERAWDLANRVDLLAPDLLDRTGATLVGVRQLVHLCAGGKRVPKARKLADLDRTLLGFTRALSREPARLRY